MADSATTAQRPLEALTAKDYRSDVKPVWCPGCGDFGVLSATFKALAALQIPKHQVVVVSGIGCSSRSPYFMSTFGLHGVHGRALPIATGVKLARPDLTVLVMGGDGDLMAIGMGHLPHAAARNIDITCIMMDNQTYGLTKGQASPTSFLGHKAKSTPYGVFARPINPVLMALASGATFVARGYSARPNQLAQLIVEGIKHRGFSFIHVHSPCVEFYNTYDYYDERVTDLPPDWDRHNLKAAMELALTETQVHLGIFYQEETPAYDERLRQAAPERKEFDLRRFLEEKHM
ncbi:MAG: 2-oxoacid:ferredoxin oxidoreductase subunit beta [Dehalococcoidia bacterium]|jgi:2-oxoglutarate ferredoxin oxidoreductase subunit beta|nr:2-oxoacid:ferredoxin oxidoreductase subunit beta [Dehalococcoidia bacterium]